MSDGASPDYGVLLKRALLKLEDLQGKLDAAERSRQEPIAVVGIGCRFPRGANDPEAFWRNLCDGVDGITEIPKDRWDVDAYYDPEPGAPGKMYARHGGFLDRVDGFDADFFGIAPREAMSADPQHRLLLEVVWEALEHAGQAPAGLGGSLTGVFIGIGSTDYQQLQTRSGDPAFIDAYFGSGMSHSIASGRISYVLGLQGPSLAVDTACSSSLVAVHLACQSLRLGECHLAVAGGVNLMLSPDGSIATSQARMLSPDGRCKTFDAGADGYVRAEGCGIVVLKRLSDAVASHDYVLALIRGTAVNQDGRSSGLTAPNGPAQEAVIRDALAKSGVSGDKIGYVETHGTGTTLGDPIEVCALGAVLGAGRPKERPLWIGGVKTNIGHLEAAAGVAGLIKAILALEREEIPPHLHFKKPNPHIPWDSLPVKVVTQRTPWPHGSEPRLSGVSSFGFSGTNCHIIVEEAPRPTVKAAAPERPQHLLSLSARSESALMELAGGYAAHLSAHPEVSLADVSFTAGTGRSHFAHRLAVRTATSAEARERLEAFRGGAEAAGLFAGRAEGGARPEIAFLFTGQGSQYVGMGRQLYETQPSFRRALDRCDELLRPLLGEPLLSVLYPVSRRSPIDETAYTQPALFSLEYALAELLRSWGVEPTVVMGHSVGEYVAACVAGLFALEDGLRLIAERGRLMQALPQDGEMAAVFADEAQVAAAVAPHKGTVSIAAVNGPANVVISGAGAHVRAILADLQAQRVKSQGLTVSHAFHSPLMDPMLDPFERAAGGLAYASPGLGIVSNVTGRMAQPGQMARGDYWRRHVREAVHFSQGMQTLREQGISIFMEIGPSPTLLGMGKRCLPSHSGAWLPTLRKGREDWTQLLESVGDLYVRGVAIDWAAFDRDYARRRVPLPTYPFQRERCWLETATLGTRAPPALSRGATGTGHPLLGVRLRSALAQAQFEAELSADAPAWIRDHAFYGRPVMPAAAYCEMALSAAVQTLGPGSPQLAELRIDEPLVFAESERRLVQTILTPEAGAAAADFQVLSFDEKEGVWRRHASGTVAHGGAAPGAPEGSLEDAKQRCCAAMPVVEYYAKFAELGVGYGPSFQTIDSLWRSDGEALARLRLPEAAAPEAGWYLMHPGLLDAGFQLLGAARPGDNESVYMPTSLDRLALRGPIPVGLWSHAVVRSENADGFSADIRFFDDGGTLLVEALGLSLRRARRETLERAFPKRFSDWLYELAWHPQPLTAQAARVHSEGMERWLVFTDAGGVGVELACRLRERGDSVGVVCAGERFEAGADGRYTINPRAAEDFRRLLKQVPAPTAVVYLWALDQAEAHGTQEPSLAAIDQALARSCGGALHLMQALASIGSIDQPRLWLVTRGAQRLGAAAVTAPSLAQSPLWGLGRTLALEHPGLRCVRIDLDPQGGGEDQLVRELAAEEDGREDQVAYRGSERHVARLVRADAAASPAPAESLQLQIRSRGVLDNLMLQPVARRPPGRCEVEIRVEATGLNFRDVLNALGMYPGDAGSLGNECAGRVVAVGEGVEGVAVGDDVLAMADASFSSYVTTGLDFVAPRPTGMGAAEAATIPIAFLTAHHALNHLARMRAGERVLIHAAAGGVGLAAVQLAQRAGAVVFATAGNEDKRAFLRSLGVPHVFDSRSLSFAGEVMEETRGEGVDVVLNSLTGDFIPKSFSVLTANGRFLEIGRRGIWDEEQVRRNKPGAAYHVIYLGELADREPRAIREMLAELLEAFRNGSLRPLPLRAFPLRQAADAFRYMAQAKHIGKVVVTQDAVQGAGLPARPDRSYLITGGLTGLGLVTARWLVERGARHLVLVGRRAPSEGAKESLAELEQRGARVLVMRADVSEPEAVRSVLSQIAATLPPLAGIVHSAGVLDDGVLLQQDWSRFEKVLAPKVRGAWTLHEQTRGLPLDFFVLYSSVASLLGSPGQGNYAAANAFLDALAHYRRAQGLAAQSVNWGTWGEVGMAAALQERDQRRREDQGIGLIDPGEGARALEHLMSRGWVQAAVLPMDWPKFLRQFPAGAEPRLLSLIAQASRSRVQSAAAGTTPGAFLRSVEAAPEGTRADLLLSHVRDQVTRVLGLDPSRPPALSEGLTDIGMDSLMAVELRNWLEGSLGRTLPATLVYEHPTIASLVAFLSGEVLSLTPARGRADESQGAIERLEAEVEGLSKDEIQASLLTELERAGY